ncbi:alpha/beta hydrolase [Aquiflexum sp. TKW24L]|uniref:alpha/beta fold hydrolase n=1 Tax=Aquiflexum sp. TKW24L TaxID=2942212 RepID=UPI0020BEE9CF|nr:alpha/beta hydrolase [Aquiflexum sp. TKW24L]MCL6260147.1 alpha/beta hydrolase [Aquiflexum sp. TKW24L]
MKIKYKSYFKDPKKDIAYFEDWVRKLEKENGRKYQRHAVKTSLGNTHVWSLNTDKVEIETLVIFPGARTTALIWDFDKGLDHLKMKLRIFMVETNGLPNLSDGATPDIKTLDYGHWAKEVFEGLGIEKAFIAGASFGGLICMKLALTNPEKIKSAFLFNPGCLQPFSLKLSNLYYNLLPIISTNSKNIQKFLERAVFSKPNHQLSSFAEKMLVDYEVFAISRYKDNTQKPYYMDTELAKVKTEIYLLLGDKDLLFPFEKSKKNAQKHLSNLTEIKIFQHVGHGIETFEEAMNYIGDVIASIQK